MSESINFVGQILTDAVIKSEVLGRDAVHFAIVPVTANQKLKPGDHVGLIDSEKFLVGTNATELVGIVDPFLEQNVKKGDKFWLFLYAQSITGLRHVWNHKSFPTSNLIVQPNTSPEPKYESPSEVWIKEYAESLGVNYEELLKHAENYVEFDQFWVGGAEFEGERVPDEFWDHYEIVTGKKVDKGNRGSFFSCSCY